MVNKYTSTRQFSCITLGVIDRWYVMHHRDGRHFIVQSMDGQGSTWTISSRIGRCCDRTGGSSMFLFIWHKGGKITSLLPPKYGWEDAVVKSESESMFDLHLDSPFGVDSEVQAKSIKITCLIT